MERNELAVFPEQIINWSSLLRTILHFSARTKHLRELIFLGNVLLLTLISIFTWRYNLLSWKLILISRHVRDVFRTKSNIHDIEAVVGRCSIKKVFLRISQNSQENTCV